MQSYMALKDGLAPVARHTIELGIYMAPRAVFADVHVAFVSWYGARKSSGQNTCLVWSFQPIDFAMSPVRPSAPCPTDAAAS